MQFIIIVNNQQFDNFIVHIHIDLSPHVMSFHLPSES